MNMSVLGVVGLSRATEKKTDDERNQMRNSEMLPVISTLPQPDRIIFKTNVSQYGNVHYQPLPV